MEKIIGVTELQRNFRLIFDEVSKRRIPYILTRGGKPEAVLIPYDDYIHYKEKEEVEVLTGFDKMWQRVSERNQEYTLEEIQAEIDAARDELD